jgi:outer membrane protein assembly factor BamB
MKLKILVPLSLIALAAALALAQQAPSSSGPLLKRASGNVDWPQYNFDPAHDGYNPYETILSPTTVGNVILQWSYQASEGPVQSTPAVVGGVVYVGAGTGYFDQNFAVYALNANTGDFLWKYVTTGPAFGAPAVASGVVYTVGGNVYALSANTGALIWQSQLSNCAFSPTLVNGVLYVVCGRGTVYAMDAETGTIIWAYSTGGRILSSPAAANGMLYVSSGDESVYALDAGTGALIWQRQLGRSLSIPATLDSYPGGQAVANGVLYVGVERTGPENPYDLYALDAATGAIHWRATLGSLVASTPSVANGTVYVGSDSRVYALDASTGTIAWQYQVAQNFSATSPIVANGVLYVPTIDCCGFGVGFYTLVALNADTGTQLWSYATGTSETRNTPAPAVVNGMIYGYDNGLFGAFGLPNASHHWR